MLKKSPLNILFVILLVLASPAHAESFLKVLEHSFSSSHHTHHSESSSNEPMGEDDSIVGDPGSIRSEPICTAQYFEKTVPTIINPKLGAKTKLGCYDFFTVMHSGLTRTPLWSAEHLTRDNIVAASHIKRENPFHPEDRLPSNERAELSDYARSGYDRGHMSPNKDMPNKLAQYQCFTLANMIPQNPNNNQNLWEGIESSVRTLTKHNGDLYVITGPLFIGEKLLSLKNHVLIPTHIFKAVLDPKTKRAAAYLVQNETGMDYKVISIAELERIAGLNLFPTLSQSAKNSPMELPAPKPHRERN